MLCRAAAKHTVTVEYAMSAPAGIGSGEGRMRRKGRTSLAPWRDLIMWLLYARAPVPDAPYWPGRRLLAFLDAVVWPVVIAALIGGMSLQTGVVGSLTLALCVLFGVRRCVRALWRIERYQFTTLRWGWPLAALLAVGAALKLAAA